MLSPQLLLLLQDLSVFSSIKGIFITYLYVTPYYVIVVYCVECLDALKMREINKDTSATTTTSTITYPVHQSTRKQWFEDSIVAAMEAV